MRNLILISVCLLLFSACNQNNKNGASTVIEVDSIAIKAIQQQKIIDSLTATIEAIPKEKTKRELKLELDSIGFKTYNYINPISQDTLLMQQYFMVFFKSGPIRNQNEEESSMLQEAHLQHLTKMHQEGFVDLLGPFADDGEVKGITVYNVPTLKTADSLAKLDPLVKTGGFVIEIHPWWAVKGNSLR